MQKPATVNYSYSLIALGNVWLQTLHMPSKDKEKEKWHQDRALPLYKTVLKKDPRNIWAANGVDVFWITRDASQKLVIFLHRYCNYFLTSKSIILVFWRRRIRSQRERKRRGDTKAARKSRKKPLVEEKKDKFASKAIISSFDDSS